VVERAGVRAVARGLIGLAALGVLAPAPAAADPVALPGTGSCRGCNVILISLDTLRRDRLESYGYGKPTSPNLAEFAREALVFERAYSASGATAESHMSLFTSLYPTVHGVTSGEEVRPLPAGIPLLAELLAQHGLATAGFHNGGYVSAEYGFDRGFDTYLHRSFQHPGGFGATLDWLAERGDAQFFLFLHSYHVHDPYTPRAGVREQFAPGYPGAIRWDPRALERAAEERCAGRPDCDRWRESHQLYWSQVDLGDARALAHVSGLYDGEIRELDTAFLRVLLAIERLPRDTLVVVLSDHGEAFGEHGQVTHLTLHEEITRVPLLVRHPRAPDTWGRRTDAPVSLVDVAPTLLDWLGFEAPASFQGRALAGSPASPAATGAAAPREILSEFPRRNELALVRGSRKILLRAVEGPPEEPAPRVLARVAADLGVSAEARAFGQIQLFDLASDPGELHDLGAAHPDFEPMLRAALAKLAANRAHRAKLAVLEPSPVVLPASTRRQLEALGYLE
jgi:arylsulfatase A-like enzyme